jgi:hypothetical protein
VQHTQLTSPTLTITDSVAARPLETNQRTKASARSARGKRPPSAHHHLSYELIDRGVIAVFAAMLLSTMVRHLPMLGDFFTYLYLMTQRIGDAAAALF